MPTFLHVGDNAGQLETEHPCQGSSPCLKLVTQPPTQLPVALASLASFADTDSGAEGACVVCDVRWTTALWVTALCIGRATRLGASIVTLGSEAAEPVAVCDIAVPLRPHINSMVAVLATTRVEEDLMAISSQCGAANSTPRRRVPRSDNWGTVDRAGAPFKSCGAPGVDKQRSREQCPDVDLQARSA